MISKPSDLSNINMKVIILEPFYGGSHKQLIDFLQTLPFQFELVTLPAKKWHWRARTSALYLSQNVEKDANFDCLFCSSVLNLSELLSLRPDLARIKNKIVYFHENQLAYPVQEIKERDFQYGYNQILTCLAADKVVFNSKYNMESFLEKFTSFFKIQPDFRPNVKMIKQEIEGKAQVLYFPVKLPQFRNFDGLRNAEKPLHILWPHRWEHDKNPEAFFQALFKLHDEQENFQVSILGETYEENPSIFEKAKNILDGKILHFGWLKRKEDYEKVLKKADVVISTANHEFFGVAMIEAAAAGCLPLVPERLVYPEIYPKEPCIYRTDNQLYKKLKALCAKPHLARLQWTETLAKSTCQKFSIEEMLPEYIKVFQ